MIGLPPPRLPAGVRDHLPLQAAERRRVAEALLGAFERWGYRRIVTPAFEYESVLARGLGESVRGRAVRFVEPGSGEVVVLRPDITPQVARLAATRLAGEPGPIRLCYEGAVVRLGEAGGQRELYQVGVELVSAPAPAGDAEVIALAAFALQAAGLERFTIDLGEAAFAKTALAGIDDPQLAAALEHKDAGAVAERVRALRLPPARAKLIEALPSLYGGRELIARARRLAGAGEARVALDRLAQLVARLEARGLGDHLALDLGEVGGFDYYTGARFHGFAPGAGGALASGGRYDRLIERYGAPAQAAGFAVDVAELARALAARGPRTPAAPSGILIGGARDPAAGIADALRRRGQVVTERLDGGVAGLREEMARGGFARAIWIEAGRGRFWDAGGGAGELSGKEIEAAIKGRVGRIGG